MKKKIAISIAVVLSLVIITLTGLVLTGCQTRGIGEMETRDMQLYGFTSLRVSGSFIVELTLAEEFSVEITMQSNLFAAVDARVDTTGQLNIGTFTGRGIRTTIANTPRVAVSAPAISAISTSGSSRVSSEQVIEAVTFGISTSGSSRIDLRLDANRIDVNTSGSATVDLEVYANYFNIESSGSSTFNLVGEVTNLDIRTSGSARINAFYLYTHSVNLRASGSARIDITVSHSITANVSGSGRVRYRGYPHHRNFSTSGSGTVNQYR